GPPGRRVCPPAAQPYGSPRICDLPPAPRRRSERGRTAAAAHLGLYREGQASFVQARDEEAVACEPELRSRRDGLSVWRDRGRRARVQAARADQPCCVVSVAWSVSKSHDLQTSSLSAGPRQSPGGNDETSNSAWRRDH